MAYKFLEQCVRHEIEQSLRKEMGDRQKAFEQTLRAEMKEKQKTLEENLWAMIDNKQNELEESLCSTMEMKYKSMKETLLENLNKQQEGLEVLVKNDMVKKQQILRETLQQEMEERKQLEDGVRVEMRHIKALMDGHVYQQCMELNDKMKRSHNKLQEELTHRVDKLTTTVNKLQSDLEAISETIPKFNIETTCVIANLPEKTNENIHEKCQSLLKMYIPESDIPKPLFCERMKSHNSKPGLVQMQLRTKKDKDLVLLHKNMLNELDPPYNSIFIRSSTTTVERLNRANLDYLLSVIQNGDDFKISSSGKLVKKAKQDRQESKENQRDDMTLSEILRDLRSEPNKKPQLQDAPKCNKRSQGNQTDIPPRFRHLKRKNGTYTNEAPPVPSIQEAMTLASKLNSTAPVFIPNAQRCPSIPTMGFQTSPPRPGTTAEAIMAAFSPPWGNCAETSFNSSLDTSVMVNPTSWTMDCKMTADNCHLYQNPWTKCLRPDHQKVFNLYS